MDRRPASSPRRVAGFVPAALLSVGTALGMLLGGCTSTPPTAEPGVDEPGSQAEVEATDADAFPTLGTAADGLDETVVRVTADSGTHDVRAKVADTDVDRQRGLMGVLTLPAGTGMLFLFDEDRTGGFWMRDTLVPLDIAYLDADGTIAAILAMEPCEEPDARDCPVYTPSAPYRAALEVPQGWFASVSVAAGDVVAWEEPVPSTVEE